MSDHGEDVSLEQQKPPEKHFATQSNSGESATPVKPYAIDIDVLKNKYIDQQPTSKTGWLNRSIFHYVRLNLVEKKDGDGNHQKQPLSNLKDIFYHGNERCPRLILVTGGPGMGKTTLANEICLQWARDGFLADEFDAVINIPLKLVQEESSFETVLEQHVGEECYPEVKKLAGRGCLLILEGLDEMPLDCRQNDKAWNRLIKHNTLLGMARILITSRPYACEKLVAHRRVEVVGFGDKEIEEFVEQSFPKDAKEFMNQLTEYPHLYSLCQVPVYLVMIIDIFLHFNQRKKLPSTLTELHQCNQKKTLPSTLTELYQSFIVMILEREVEKGHIVKKLTVGDHVSHSVRKLTVGDHAKATLKDKLPGIFEDAVEIVYKLCDLAYNAFFKSYSDRKEKRRYGITERWKDPKMIFTESDLTKSGIEVTSEFDGFGLLKLIHTPINMIMYDFLHLTVQEFLCSLYISTLSEEDQRNKLSEHFSDYPNVMMFLCGLTGLASIEMFNFVYSKLASSKNYYPGVDHYVLNAVRCVYESKHRFSNPSTFTLYMSWNTLLPYDCLCLSWLLSCYPVSELQIKYCRIEDAGAKLLVRHYPDSNSTGQQLEVLHLGSNNLTIAGLKYVMKILRTSSATLRELNVKFNQIGDAGMSMISEELLQHNNSLTKLSLGGCGLSKEGATAISELLMDKKCMIKELDMSSNDIGDNGIEKITTALSNSIIISILVVNGCGITKTGATSIAKLLSDNNSINELWLLDNSITKDGAERILHSAVDNEACQVNICIDDEYKSAEVLTMMKILEDRRKILDDRRKIKINMVNTTTATTSVATTTTNAATTINTAATNAGTTTTNATTKLYIYNVATTTYTATTNAGTTTNTATTNAATTTTNTVTTTNIATTNATTTTNNATTTTNTATTNAATTTNTVITTNTATTNATTTTARKCCILL